MTGTFAQLRHEAPFIAQDGNLQSLHFSHGEVQSSMRLDRPDELQVDYTRTMMGFVLLQPQPRGIGLIGLGGGSLVKFCHRHLGTARITAVEINPQVIALRRQFRIPDDGERLSVLAADGAQWVRESRGGLDVLLVDGFDAGGQPPALCSQAFYDGCFQALASGGVLVVNLHHDHPDHPRFLGRIAQAFQGNAMQVVSREKGNCVVFAGRRLPITLQALRSLAWAAVLAPAAQRELRGEFAHIGWNACALTHP